MLILPSYIHIVKPHLKHIYLSFDEIGNLVIKSPKVTTQKIEQILLKKSAWINSSREKIEKRRGKNSDVFLTKDLYFKGRVYPICFVQKSIKTKPILSFDDIAFTLIYKNYDESIFQKLIDNFYLKEAKQYIPSLVDNWSKKLSLYPQKLSFRKTKRQWGSCSSVDNISISTMAMKLPQDVIEYIVVHELTHIKYKHHQKAFWNHLERYIPNYKTLTKELKLYTT